MPAPTLELNRDITSHGHVVPAVFYVDDGPGDLGQVDGEVKVSFDAMGLPGPFVIVAVGDNVCFRVVLGDLLDAIARDSR